jgi:hypothetical protein
MKKVVLFAFLVLAIVAAEGQLPFITATRNGLHTDNVTSVTNDSKRYFRKTVNRKNKPTRGANSSSVHPGKNKFLRGVPN